MIATLRRSLRDAMARREAGLALDRMVSDISMHYLTANVFSKCRV